MYYVSFLANEKPAGYMCVKEDMSFAELSTNFCKNFGLKEDNIPTFSFNSQQIKFDSNKTLKELGITNMAVITAKTPKEFTIPQNNVNAGNNAGMNNNQFMGNFGMNPAFYQNMNGYYQNMNGYYQNMNPGFYQNMNPGFYQNINQFQNPTNPIPTNPIPTNPNPTNPNPTNPNAGNGEFLNITFYYKGAPIQIQSTSNVRFCDLYTNKFIVKAGSPQKPPSFYLNNNRIDSTETKTLGELNISNNAIIQAADDGKSNSNDNSGFLNIIFNCQGKTISVQATSNTRMCDLAKSFCNKGGYVNKDPTFIINSKRIESTETKTLKELNIINQAKIEVIFSSEVIGA